MMNDSHRRGGIGDIKEGQVYVSSPTRFALDFVIKGEDGKAYRYDGTRNEDYYCWDQPVYAVESGRVVIAIKDQPDTPTPGGAPIANQWGNVVLIDHGDFEDSFYCHLKYGSVSVNVGDIVVKGQRIANVGNSGTSIPHLHYQLVKDPSGYIIQMPPFGPGATNWEQLPEGIPSVFNDFCLVDGEEISHIDRGVLDGGLHIKSNYPPVLDPIGAKTVDEGKLLSFTISATDPDGDPLTYSATGLPAGANFDPTTGAFDWTPNCTQAGNYDITFTASDDTSTDSKTVTITVNNVTGPPSAGTVIPSLGASAANQAVTFTTTYTDPDGWQDIKEAYFLVSTAINGNYCLYAYYDQYTKKIYLYNDTGGWLGGYAPGTAATLKNSYVSLDYSKTTISGTNDTLTINWCVTFLPAFTGQKNIYVFARDVSGNNTGWVQKGSWTITPPITIDTVTPSSGSSKINQPVTFTTTVSHTTGYASINQVYFLVSTAINGNYCLYAYYDKPTNKIYLYKDTGGWLGGYAPGTAATLKNSYVSLDYSKTTVSGANDTLTINWCVTFLPAFTGQKNIYVFARDVSGNNTGFVQKGSWDIIPNEPPTADSLSPSSGSLLPNKPLTFTATYTDPDGWEDIQYTYFLVNTAINGARCLLTYYDRNANKLYLANDAFSGWLGGFAPGSGNVIENSYAKLNCAQTTVSGSGTTLTMNWNAEFKPAFTGLKNTYIMVADSAVNTGWLQKGTWYIGNKPPTADSLTPSSGSSTAGQAATFTATYTDPDGWQNIQYAHLLVNTAVSGAKCLLAYYDQNANKLYLMNDTGAGPLGGFEPGFDNTIENSYAKLNCKQTTVSGSGTTLTIGWSVAFKGSFLGQKNTYLYVSDNAGGASGWVQKGTWNIVNKPPTADSINPSSGTSKCGESVNFTTTLSDPDGWEDIKEAYFLVSTSINGNYCLYAYYDRPTNKIYLYKDTGGWLGGYAPGTAATLKNSYVSLDYSKTTVSGADNTLTINWCVSFLPAFTGQKNIYVCAKDVSGANTGFVQKGTWNIVASRPPFVGSISSPTSGSSRHQQTITFTATYVDPDGWEDIKEAYFLVNTFPDGARCLYAKYDKNANKLYLASDDGGAWAGGFAPESNNVIESSYAKLNCGQTKVFGSETTLTVMWTVTFKPPFLGLKNLYISVVDNAGGTSGWVQKGTWNIVNKAFSTDISPSSASSPRNQAVDFTATYTDPDGWQDIKEAYFSASPALNKSYQTGSLCAYYNPSANQLYLRDSIDKAWLGGFEPGSNNIIESDHARLNCAQTKVSGSGNTLIIVWNVEFKAKIRFGITTTGLKNTYLYVSDKGGSASGWIQKGTWDIVDRPPSVDNVSPSSGSSVSNHAVTFTTIFSDPDGWEDIEVVVFEVGGKAMLYYPRFNQFSMPGNASSYIQLNRDQTTVSTSGTTLTINWNVEFKPSFIGQQNVVIYAHDKVDVDSSRVQGTWKIYNNTPSVGTITPSSGRSNPDQFVNFTTTFSDPDGWQDIKTAALGVTAGFITTPTMPSDVPPYVVAYYDQSVNKLYLAGDPGSGCLLGGFSPGANNVIENSYGRLYCAQTTVSGSGKTLTITWRIAFKPAFLGQKNTYLYVKDISGAASGDNNSGWVGVGTWNIKQ